MPVVIFAAPYFTHTAKRFIEATVNLPEVWVGLISRFGGHAMAAGLTLREADLPRFTQAIEAVAREALDPALLQRICSALGKHKHALAGHGRQRLSMPGVLYLLSPQSPQKCRVSRVNHSFG